MTIPTHLIENALNLTGKKIEEMRCDYYECSDVTIEHGFSFENFCFYLLSESFIYAYINATVQRGKTAVPDYYSFDFLKAIRQNESGNPGPLISLLEKIPGKE